MVTGVYDVAEVKGYSARHDGRDSRHTELKRR